MSASDLMNKPQIIEHARKSLTQTVYDTRWIPCSARFVVLGSPPRGSGLIQIYSLSKGEVSLLHEVRAPRAPRLCVCVCGAGPSRRDSRARGAWR
jgi:hypothetical protein